jgi:hypothetical protein
MNGKDAKKEASRHMLFNAMGLTLNPLCRMLLTHSKMTLPPLTLFGVAPSFKAQVQHPTVSLDKHQFLVIKANFKAEHPKSLTAYSDETLHLLSPNKEFEELLTVPIGRVHCLC